MPLLQLGFPNHAWPLAIGFCVAKFVLYAIQCIKCNCNVCGGQLNNLEMSQIPNSLLYPVAIGLVKEPCFHSTPDLYWIILDWAQ